MWATTPGTETTVNPSKEETVIPLRVFSRLSVTLLPSSEHPQATPTLTSFFLFLLFPRLEWELNWNVREKKERNGFSRE